MLHFLGTGPVATMGNGGGEREMMSVDCENWFFLTIFAETKPHIKKTKC